MITPDSWLELATRNTAAERNYERLAADAWRDHDYLKAIRFRGIAEGLVIARDNQLAIAHEHRATKQEQP